MWTADIWLNKYDEGHCILISGPLALSMNKTKMNDTLSTEIRDVLDAVHYRPALSVILPIETEVSLQKEMAHRLKVTADKAERELRQYYPDEQSSLVMQKFRNLITALDIPLNKKGIAIYVSPLFEKVLYLDCPVTEKLIVDESFEIRDLLYSAKEDVKYILLILSAMESKVFRGDLSSLRPLESNIPKSASIYMNDLPERVSNFSDMGDHKQILIDKFLYHIDEELGNLLNEQPLPILVLGAERILGQFKKLSKHTGSVMAYVAGNYESATIAELRGLTQPLIRYYRISQQQELLGHLDDMASQHRLSTGILQVWQDAQQGKGQMLVVERSYRFAAQHGPEPSLIEAAEEPYDHFAYIRDAVDDLIEMLLANGGDVTFTEDGALEQFDHIALIKYYDERPK